MSEYQPHIAAGSSVQLVAVVVDAGLGEQVLQLCRDSGALLEFMSMCHGTARTDMLDLLGLGESPKELVIALVSTETAHKVLSLLAQKLQMRYPGRGIAFAVPVGSIGVRVHKMLTQFDQKEEPEMHTAANESGFDVVAAILDQGYTNVAMDAARKAGARGGTVISARGVAQEEVRHFLGMEIQAEKEIVFVVVRSEEKQAVMAAVMQAAGLRTESRGIVLSFPVSGAVGLAD